jgi:hypothetical protein
VNPVPGRQRSRQGCQSWETLYPLQDGLHQTFIQKEQFIPTLSVRQPFSAAVAAAASVSSIYSPPSLSHLTHAPAAAAAAATLPLSVSQSQPEGRQRRQRHRESILAKAAYLPTFWKLGVALQEGKSSSRSERTSKTSALTVSRLVIPCARAGRRRRTQVELQSEE